MSTVTTTTVKKPGNNTKQVVVREKSTTSKNRRRRQRRKALLNQERSGVVMSNGQMIPNSTRSGIKPNPADPRTDLTLLQMGNTVLGRGDVLKILHPCGESDSIVAKYPDGGVATSVGLERRDEYVLTNPTGGSGNWTVIVLHMPFLKRRDVAIAYQSGAVGITQSAIWTMIDALLIRTDKQLDGATYPNWMLTAGPPAFWVTLMGSSVLFDGLLDKNEDSSGILKAESFMRTFRRTAIGYTTDLDASDLYNQGRVVSGQWSSDVSLGTQENGATPPVVVDAYNFTLPAVTTSTIVASDEFSRQCEAKTGSYMPLRPFDKVDFTQVAEMRNINPTGPDAVVETMADFADKAVDGWLRGWCIGVEVWDGLATQANLRMKVRECLEVVPSPNSPYSPFATPGHPQDDRAQSIIREYCRREPHAYPADFNFLNGLFDKILGGVKKVVSTLGLPTIGRIAGQLLPGVAGKVVQAGLPLLSGLMI